MADAYRSNLQATVRRIDQEIDTCQLILRDVKTKLIACRTRRNACSLINSLPQDIVLLIFLRAMEEKRDSLAYYPGLFALRSVCKAWRACIDDYPPFWLSAFPAQSEDLHDLTISRSQKLTFGGILRQGKASQRKL